MIGPAITVPLMSTIDSSQQVRGHSHKRSHQRSNERLIRPFTLPRIPSERLDPRSFNYGPDSVLHGSGQARDSPDNRTRHVSSGEKGFLDGPSLPSDGPLNIPKRPEATTLDPRAIGSRHSQAYDFSSRSDARSETNAAKMGARSRSLRYSRDIFSGIVLVAPFVLLPIISSRYADPFASPTVLSTEPPVHEPLSDLFLGLLLTSCTLILLGAYGRYWRKKMQASTPQPGLGVSGDTNKTSTVRIDSRTGFRIARRILGIVLPFIAAFQLGSLNLSVLLLVLVSSRVVPMDEAVSSLGRLGRWKRLFSLRPWTVTFSGLLCLSAVQYPTNSRLSSIFGLLAMVISTFLCNPQYLVRAPAGGSLTSPSPLSVSTSTVPSIAWDSSGREFSLPVRSISSPLISSSEETSLTMISGAVAAAGAALLFQVCELSLTSAESLAILPLISLITTWSLSQLEIAVFGEGPIPLAAGLVAASLGKILISSRFHTSWHDVVGVVVAWIVVQLDMVDPKVVRPASLRTVSDESQARRSKRKISAPTRLLLRSTEQHPLLHGILADKDSRRIFYFMLLNLSFMLIQSTYGVLTGSLGLISDSIHMFFDCFALLVGLCAAVMSKWPPSVKYPYGYGKLDTLAGFGNGIFLMLISIEIVWEAIERLVEGSDVSRTVELLIVSSLGLVVNLVGIMAFEHGHGHGHSHHGHGHGGHAQPSHSASAGPSVSEPKQSHHQHGGDNMYGIYLHIMADALGSVAVVISTLCVRYFGWSGFDPLASCTIAILIFASAIPLVFSSGKKLLLSLPGDVEYTVRDTLSGISEIRGVVGYTAPKFWIDDIGKTDSEHEHHHHDHHRHSEQPNDPDPLRGDHHHISRHEYEHEHEHEHSQHQHQHHHHHHHHHPPKSNVSNAKECGNEEQVILGVIHVIASQYADLDDVQTRVLDYLRSKNMDIVVQIERDGDSRCWCGGSQRVS